MNELPLSSYRALDLCDEKGLLCGQILGSLGAETIKVEPLGGSRTRNFAPFFKDIPSPGGSLFWLAYNSNKKGITLNIESKDGQEIFRRLVKISDFVIESLPVGYMDRLGLSYTALSKINPKLIMVSISPFGQDGPYKDWKASDITALAMGGLLALAGYSDRPPVRCHLEQSYLHAGIQAAMAALIALHYRNKTGKGQYADVSIQASIPWTLNFQPDAWALRKARFIRKGPRAVRFGAQTIYMTYVWPCKDGQVVFRLWVGAMSFQMERLVKWMEEEGEEPPKGAWQEKDFTTVTQEEWDEWERAIPEFLKKHTKAELVEEGLLKRGIWIYPVNTIEDICNDPQISARNAFEKVSHPDLGCEITYPCFPIKSSELSFPIRQCAPKIGEHNVEIYQRRLGLSNEELLTLKHAQVI